MNEHEMKTFRQIWYESRGIGNSGCGTPLFAAIVIGILMLFSSCATKTQIEYRDRDVHHYTTKTVHDTLINKTTDSVYYEVLMKGDTVFKTKYKERTLWRDRVVERTDTCWKDSVVFQYFDKTREVVKYPKTYWWFLGFSVLFFIFAFYKIIRWLRIN